MPDVENLNLPPKRSMSILLGIGILFIPFIFSWFTLRQGYSTLSRVLSLAWLAYAFIILAYTDFPEPDTTITENTEVQQERVSKPVTIKNEPVREPEPEPDPNPTNNASYGTVNKEIGCHSKYSKEKKKDVFNNKYKNHWFTWSGVIQLVKSNNVSLNIDGVGIQDLIVDFADPKAGYDLLVGSNLTVKFLMKRSGGCFLPFKGEDGIIIKS